ncbi:hypothetical protein BC830DRAFT_244781 [Chytriomyces sp. MP71]|nr:hypothetical protein BC830DRAFT_244781 [Chytriomyces sp. MP71]
MMNVDEAENEEELPPFAKTVISLPASSPSQGYPTSGPATVLKESHISSTSTEKKLVPKLPSPTGTKPVNPLAANLPTNPSKVPTPTPAISLFSSVPDSRSPAPSSIHATPVPFAAAAAQRGPITYIPFSVNPAVPPTNASSSSSTPIVPETSQTIFTSGEGSLSISVAQPKSLVPQPALLNSVTGISIPQKSAVAGSNSAKGSSTSISSETVAAPTQETVVVAPTNLSIALASKKLGRLSKPSQPQKPKSAPTPVPTRTKQGDPTPPVFRTNEIVYVEVMLTALDTRTTRLTFPPATTTTSGTIDAPVACDISRVHTGCVFWPGIVTRVFTDTAQPVLWTTPILVDTTPAQGVNISSAACFPDTLETLTRQTRTTAAGNKSVAEVVHRRPSYQVSLHAIPNGVVSLPELYLTPFKLVQPPLDLLPRGLRSAHVEGVLGKGPDGVSAVQEGFDYGVLLFFKALLAAREIVSRGSTGQLLGGAAEDGGPQARVGGEVVEEGDLVVVKMPGSGYHGVLKVAYLDLDLNGGKFRVDGNKCHRRKNVEPGIEGLDWIRGGKERFAFGERVKGVEARWIVGRVYPQFPLVTLGSDGFLVAADLA